MNTNCKEHIVEVRSLLSVCRSFDSLLEKTLGPNGKSTLLTTPTGQVLITHVGCTILRCMNIRHPLGSMIIRSIAAHHSYTGDGSKTFVLYLTSILASIADSLENRFGFGSEQRYLLLSAVHYMRVHLSSDVVLPALQRNCVVFDISENRNVTMTTMHNLVNSCLCGKYTEIIRNHLCNLLIDFLCTGLSDFRNLPAEVSVCIDNFNLLCIDVDCMLPVSSYIYKGVIIQRDCLNFNHCPAETSHTRFILLHNCFTKTGGKSEVSSTLEAKDILSLNSIFLWKGQCSTALVNWAEKNNVNLILSTGSVDDMLHTLCLKAGISVVQFVDIEDFERLKMLFHIAAIEFISDLYEVKSEDLIGCSEVCNTQVFGQKRFVCLKLPDQHLSDTLKSYAQTPCENVTGLQMNRHICAHPCLKRQLVICGMSAGACQQIRLDLLYALKMLRVWLDSKWLDPKAPHYSAVHITGGGCFEMTCYGALEDFMKQNAGQLGVHATVCCEALCNAFLAVPLRLLHNSFQPSLATVPYIRERTKSQHTSGANISGYDGYSGCQLPVDASVIEPLMSKILLLDHVLELTEQLLRIDSLLHVKQLVQKSVCEEQTVHSLSDTSGGAVEFA